MSDRIEASCPACAAHVRAPRTAAGKRVRCPRCSQPFAIPAPVPEPIPAPAEMPDDLFTGLAAGAAVESADEQRARLEAHLAEAARVGQRAKELPATDERVVERPPRAGLDLGPWIVQFFGALVPTKYASRLNFAAVVLGAALLAHGIRNAAVSANSRDEPQTLSCAELLANGPGDNLHVVLTDFVLLPEYVYEQRTTGWNGAWVPAIAREALEVELARILKVKPEQVSGVASDRRDKALDQVDWNAFDVQLVVSFRQARSESDVAPFFDAGTLHGTVLKDQGLGGLSRERRKLLDQAYAKSNLARCWVLEEGRTPSSTQAAAYEWGGGALLVVGLIAAGWRASRALS